MAKAGGRGSDLGGALLTLAAAVLAGAGVLACAGSWRPQLDVLAHLTPLCGAGALLILGLSPWAGTLRAVVRALAVAALAATAGLMAPEFLRSAGPTAPGAAAGEIKVIQLNALRSNADIGRVADWLIAQHPDVVTVTEARPDLVRLLVSRAGWHTAGAHGDLVIFTPRPYVRMTRPWLGPKGELTFVNATYDRADGPLELMSAHLAWPTERHVGQQARELAWVAAQRPRDRMILTGDFNATPWSAAMRRLDRNLGLIRRDRAVATWPAQVMGRPWPLPFLSIDHVYAGPAWATVKVERGPWLGSDHYPLVVTLAPVAPR